MKVALLVAGLLFACADGAVDPPVSPARGGSEAPPSPNRRDEVQVGRASYYADRFVGRRTASGERYDPRALTAAHPWLPFGSMVKVTRRDGRTVDLRINDRGPFAKGRILDVSRRAAEQLGMIGDGVAVVTVRVLSVPPRPR